MFFPIFDQSTFVTLPQPGSRGFDRGIRGREWRLWAHALLDHQKLVGDGLGREGILPHLPRGWLLRRQSNVHFRPRALKGDWEKGVIYDMVADPHLSFC